MKPVKVTLKPDKRTPLPTGAQLHEHVRASVPRKGNAPPAAFEESAARIAALQAALDHERDIMHTLIGEAYAEGVPQNTLARWSGYTPRWVGTLLSDAA